LESNPERFKVEEVVRLTLELKNVQTLYIKVFEFNTETYYKRTHMPFSSEINLDGLVASDERVINTFKPMASTKKFKETFTFPELSNRVGLFIIEFIGNGANARAVIKKGSLSLVHKPTIGGHAAYIIDENKKICTGPQTGVQMGNQFYQPKDMGSGKIFLPYDKYGGTKNVIVMHDGFADLVSLDQNHEKYTLTAWFHLDPESLITGNSAQLLVRPQLLINSSPAPLDLLKDLKVTVVTT
jgi:hypothetical protein